MEKSKYYCETCNYLARSKSNLIKHQKTKKHLEKEREIMKLSQSSHEVVLKLSSPKNYNCLYCNKNFVNAANLNRHKRTCEEKKVLETKFQEKIKELEYKIKQLEKDLRYQKESSQKESQKYKELYKKDNFILEQKSDSLKQKDETIRILQNELEKSQKILLNNNLLKSSKSSINYITNNFINAPELKTLTNPENLIPDQIKNKKYNNVGTGDDSKFTKELKEIINHNKVKSSMEGNFVELILYYYKEKILSSFIGKYVIDIYKKNDPNEQSIWNTDPSRLSYIIKKIIKDNKSKWKIDKKGLETQKHTIIPITDYLINLLEKYQVDEIIGDIGYKSPHSHLEKRTECFELINYIKTGELSRLILKYISPTFYYSPDDNNLIENRIEYVKKDKFENMIKNKIESKLEDEELFQDHFTDQFSDGELFEN